MLEGKKIVFISEKSGFSDRVERYIYQTARLLKKHGARVFGAFFEHVPGTQQFQSVFDGLYAPDNLSASDIDLLCVHKLPSIAHHKKIQSAFGEKVALFLHDHSSYCPRTSKIMPFSGRGCDRSYNRCFCSICGMMRSPSTWTNGLVSEINEKVVLFQDNLDIIRKYQHTVVLSCFMRDNLLSNGFSPASLHVIPPYIFIPQKMTSHKNTPLPMILFISQLNSGENARTFIEVLSRLRNPFQATIIGDGKDKPALEKLVKKKGLETKVTFKGLSNPEEYFPLADLALIPISNNEPYSLAVAECAAWGLPVVSSLSKGLEEALQNGVTGFTASNHDIDAMTIAVEKLLVDPDLRQELGAHGYKLVSQNFAEEEFIRKFEKLLDTTTS